MVIETLSDIVRAVKTGESDKVTREQLIYALAAMDGLLGLEANTLMDMAQNGDSAERRRRYLEEAMGRRLRAVKLNPRDYLGDNNDPFDTEVQARIKHNMALFDKILTKIEKGKH